MKAFVGGEPVGIGGWLYVVALGVLLSPLRYLKSFADTIAPVLGEGIWATLTTPGSSAYHPLWAPLILLEVLGNFGFLLASIAMLVLFVKRSANFPNLFTWTVALTVPFIAIHGWLASRVLADEPGVNAGTVAQLVSAIIVIAIWVPYMMLSKRVRNTFVA